MSLSPGRNAHSKTKKPPESSQVLFFSFSISPSGGQNSSESSIVSSYCTHRIHSMESCSCLALLGASRKWLRRLDEMHFFRFGKVPPGYVLEAFTRDRLGSSSAQKFAFCLMELSRAHQPSITTPAIHHHALEPLPGCPHAPAIHHHAPAIHHHAPAIL